MSFLNKLFGSEDAPATKSKRWMTISTSADLDAAVEKSYNCPVVIFKHSTSCFISKTVLRNFERELESYKGDATFYYLDLLAFRSVSNEIANRLKVTHQSPQMIIIKDGEAVKNASHQAVTLSLL